MKTLNFNKLTTADVDVFISMKKDFFAIDGYSFNEVVALENTKYFIDHPELGEVFLITDDQGRVNGFIILVFFFSFEFGGSVILLDELYLAETARGKGIGRAAVQFVKEFARNRGFKRVLLEIEHHNNRAKGLYLNEEFADHHRGLMIYNPGD